MIWIIGSIAIAIAAAVGGIADVTSANATMLAGGFAILFLFALLAFASRGSSPTE